VHWISLLVPALAATAPSPSEYTRFDGDVFSFEVPTAWHQVKGRALAAFRQQYSVQSAELYRQYHASLDDDDTGVPFLAVFKSIGEGTTLVVLRMRIPPQATGYWQTTVGRTQEVITWGIRSGRVRRAISNRMIRIRRMQAHNADLEMSDGKRLIGYSFYSSQHPYQVIQVVALLDSAAYASAKSKLDHVIRTLEITIERDLTIGGRSYRLSAEAQRYLVVNGESDYPANHLVLIIQEPHYDTEAQWNVYRGLSVLLEDNPDLVAKTAFLGEGLKAHDSLDVLPLISRAPDPLEPLVRIVLRSYLIPAYVAYEWSFESGIPIVGIEDGDLYEASAALWTAGEQEHWPRTVIARNTRMVEVLLASLRKYPNSILFVGGMHLHQLADSSYALNRKERHELIRPDVAARVTASKNLGIADLLRQAHVGYVYLEAVSHATQVEDRREGQRYREVFIAQSSGNYQPYIQGLVPGALNSLGGLVESGVTVRPSPQAGADLLASVQQAQSSAESGTGRKKRVDRAQSPVWKKLKPWRREVRTDGKGKSKRYYTWDSGHGPADPNTEIEVFDKNGQHLGALDPVTGVMKPNSRAKGREIQIHD
jgi:hypothetical protein